MFFVFFVVIEYRTVASVLLLPLLVQWILFLRRFFADSQRQPCNKQTLKKLQQNIEEGVFFAGRLVRGHPS